MTRWLPNDIRARLTLWYAAGMALIVGAFAAGSFWLFQREIHQRSDRLLDEASRAFGNELALELEMLGSRERAIDEALRGVRFRGVALGVLGRGPGDTLVTASAIGGEDRGAAAEHQRLRKALVEALPALHRGASDEHAFLTLPASEGGIRVVLTRVPFGTGNYATVVAARDRREDRETLENVGLAFAALVLASLVAALVGGYALARRTLAPIATFSQQATAISAADLSARVPIANPRDELGKLGGVINDLLQRLESAFVQQRQFMTDASHELRTPLTIVRNEASTALDRPERAGDEYREALQVVERESRRLSTLVDDLFLMARADSGGQPLRPEPVYLDDMLREVTHAARTLAAQKSIELTCDAVQDAEYRADEGLLRRAVVNLVDNALKHTPAEGRVHVALVRAPGQWEVRVSDTGPGISDEQRLYLFDRFSKAVHVPRGPSAQDGTGLGLSITRWIVAAHGGTLSLESTGAAGSTFLFTLPV